MPFIQTTTNVSLTKEKETALKSRFGKAIECIPGKSESWLMLAFADEQPMYFKGEGEKPAAMLEVRIYGSASSADYERLTGELTGIVQEELGVQPDRIYITYQEIGEWGWNGGNL